MKKKEIRPTEAIDPIAVVEMPKVVKIGYQYYEIKKVADPDHYFKNMEGQVFGMVDYKKSVIYIDDGLNEIDEANTLLHEVLHVIHFNAGFGCQDATSQWTNENYVVAGINGLCQVFQDNPDLVCFILNNLHVTGLGLQHGTVQ